MIGILALQGGYKEHADLLNHLGIPCREVRTLSDVDGLTGLILPGGESTVLGHFLRAYGLREWLVERVQHDPHFKVLGTCAGLIVLARYGLLSVEVDRNAYGRQLASFVSRVFVDEVGSVQGHFIRAPKITSVGKGVTVLAMHEDVPVVVRQGNVWGLSFHPELAADPQLHAAIFLC